jgi:type IV pilus assembly protein PilM
MFGLLKKANLVGLDIGSSAIKLVRLRESKKGIHLLNFDMAMIPMGTIADGSITNYSTVVEKIRDLVKLNSIKNADTALSISGHFVIVKKISLPEMTQAELEDSIQWEAEQYIPFDIKDVNMDVQILNPKAGHGQMDVLLVAAKKDVINEYVTVAQEGGLNPVVVDVATFTIQNMFEFNYGFNKNETCALVNIGANIININVISDGITTFTRDIAVGGNLLNEEIMKQLNVSWEEAEQFKTGLEGSVSGSTVVREVNKLSERISENITTEIQRSLDFFIATSMNVEINHVYLSGGGAQTPSLIKCLERRLETHVELVNPFKNIIIDSKKFDIDLLQRMAPQATVSVGLGLRKVDDRQ